MAAEQQIKLDWNQLLQEALTAPGNLYGVYDRFHDYSLTNMHLFREQGIHEPVASNSRWQSLGRRVLQGAQAKNVIVPMLITERQRELTEAPQEPTPEQVRLIGFRVVRGVYALSDTEGPALPPFEHPKWDLATALDKLQVRVVPFESTNGNLQGYSIGREIAINPVAVHPGKMSTPTEKWVFGIFDEPASGRCGEGGRVEIVTRPPTQLAGSYAGGDHPSRSKTVASPVPRTRARRHSRSGRDNRQ